MTVFGYPDSTRIDQDSMQNIEIKTPIDSIETIESRLAKHEANKIWTRKQADTFFEVPRGWLKLREADGAQPELISYLRPTDDSGPRPSTYDVERVRDGAAMKRLLSRVLDSECVVKKTRTLWIWKHTRIHLDEVDSLGLFLELEAVAGEIAIDEARREADQMIAGLKLHREKFISIPYREMIRAQVV